MYVRFIMIIICGIELARRLCTALMVVSARKETVSRLEVLTTTALVPISRHLNTKRTILTTFDCYFIVLLTVNIAMGILFVHLDTTDISRFCAVFVTLALTFLLTSEDTSRVDDVSTKISDEFDSELKKMILQQTVLLKSKILKP